jgi:tRNA(Ile)-lysidine synthase
MSSIKAPNADQGTRDALDGQSVGGLFAGLDQYPHLALAVSGGADSTALMLLIRHWLDGGAASRPAVSVLTVDHGLREEAAEEARWVGDLAAKLGFSQHILVWQGPKPHTGLQAIARGARYDLMTGFCREHGIPALVTAHNCDDQAETFLMRLSRGSGVDGLSAMAPHSRCSGVDLLRPLLTVSRQQLESFLKSRNQSWQEDPSNRETRYERVWLREALKQADTLETLGLNKSQLHLSATRLRRARQALETVTASFLQSTLKVHEAGFGSLAVSELLGQPDEIALRALVRMAGAFGGGQTYPRLAKAEAALAKLQTGVSGLTLAGCHFAVRGTQLLMTREYGRMSHHPVSVTPGQTLEWDNRFHVALPENAPAGTVLRPLGPGGVRALKDAGGKVEGIPQAALLTLPSLWLSGELAEIPIAGFRRIFSGVPAIEAVARFTNREHIFARISDHDL